MPTVFTRRVIDIIRSIPEGKVLTYGAVAAMAGNPRGARQVSRILHSSSDAYDLPWHRVVNAKGSISLGPGRGGEIQRGLLEKEGVAFNEHGFIDLSVHLAADITPG